MAEFTTDADLALSPQVLAAGPAIASLFEAAGFRRDRDRGKWWSAEGIQVDLLAPDAVAGPGRCGARLDGRGKTVARRAKGIEGALIDNEHRDITALDPGDHRRFTVRVAGPAALLVAKIHKIAERANLPDRLVAKDALDVLRILQTTPTPTLAGVIAHLCQNDTAAPITTEALNLGTALFTSSGPGLEWLAARAEGRLISRPGPATNVTPPTPRSSVAAKGSSIRLPDAWAQ